MDNPKIVVPSGTTKRKKIIGRGAGSGHGGTAGKGHKGQRARSGGGVRPGFEGGQMPLYRRIARRGFSNYPFKKAFNIINLSDLERFEDGTRITRELLIETRVVRKKSLPVKLLGSGEVSKKFIIELDKISKTAKEKVEKAGGEVIVKAISTEEETNGK